MRIPLSALKVTALALWLSVSLSGQASLASLSGDLLRSCWAARRRQSASSSAVMSPRSRASPRATACGSAGARRPGRGQARPTELAVLRQVPGIEAISRDTPVLPFMTVLGQGDGSRPGACAAARRLLGIGGYPAVTGRGVGVAVIDSGIDLHIRRSPQGRGRRELRDRRSVDQRRVRARHAHRRHHRRHRRPPTTPLYKGGIAPGAHLVNVRVLGAEGSGYTSDVIAGIQWTVANRAALRHSRRQPLARPSASRAVPHRSAVPRRRAGGRGAGLVVVASAGNNGKNASGEPVLASITTPGVAPSAITVGALNTWGTVSRDDDTIATYSSNGPTRFELGLKPDVVAPGNKIVSLEAPAPRWLRRLSGAARRRQRRQCLHDDERHQHGGRHGQRRRRAAARRRRADRRAR